MLEAMKLPLRIASLDDAGTIATLLTDFNHEYEDEVPAHADLTARLRSLMQSGDTVVALAGEPIVGLALMRFRPSLWTARQECYLAEFYVQPAHRGQGIGRQLLTYALDVARDQGADYIDLNTGETDEAARHLYESLGFSRTEQRPDGPVNYYYERDLR
jgi:ribosomal protein S18 acetylase RimI-like enzyme